MVLKQFQIINKHHKLIIIATMMVGALYPFFIDTQIPVVTDSKYVSIGLLVIGMVLFWEMYGETSKISEVQDIEQNFSKLRPNYPSQYPPYPQQYPYPPSMAPQQPQPPYNFQEPVIQRNPQQPSYPFQESPGQYQEKPLPKISDVIEGRAQVPDSLPFPADRFPADATPLKPSQKPRSSFNKFGY